MFARTGRMQLKPHAVSHTPVARPPGSSPTALAHNDFLTLPADINAAFSMPWHYLSRVAALCALASLLTLLYDAL